MDNLSSVLKRRRKELGLTLAQIADKMGVAEATVQRWESGNIKSLRHDKIVRLANLLDVAPSVIMGWSEDSSLPSPNATDDVVKFHAIGTVAAGYNEFAYQEIAEDSIDIPTSYLKGRPKSDYFLLKVTGDSMYPLYHDGDHVLVLKQDTLNRSGEIGVVLYGGDKATLKKVEYVMGEDWLRLVPINPTYKELLVENADLEQCRILGIPRVLIRDL